MATDSYIIVHTDADGLMWAVPKSIIDEQNKAVQDILVLISKKNIERLLPIAGLMILDKKSFNPDLLSRIETMATNGGLLLETTEETLFVASPKAQIRNGKYLDTQSKLKNNWLLDQLISIKSISNK